MDSGPTALQYEPHTYSRMLHAHVHKVVVYADQNAFETALCLGLAELANGLEGCWDAGNG